MRKLELLAPAKNLQTGIMAIDHGADAVYIGAEKFGARQAAGNSVDDIRQLCEYAHQFGATVHVTVNTIVYQNEIDDTMDLVVRIIEAGADALLIQDMGIFSLVKEKIAGMNEHCPALHASTQCDSRTSEKVGWLHGLGFDRIVLARELSLDEISDIHKANPGVELEAFVHGALCVSYSGVCYASQYCFSRSANRGECAQFCRLKFDLRDDSGKLIESQRHLLSLKDMCQKDHLEELAMAGVSAFKIEGRLKDAGYVKNVVSAYSQKLDDLCRKHPDMFCRASKGRVDYYFSPDLKKTFNRGYTTYFLDGRQMDIASFDTPKAIGEYVGWVKEIRRDSFNVAGTASFANGDGLCFINDDHELEGFRINKAVGNRLFPLRVPANLRPGMGLYRNNDEAFEKILAGKTAERHIEISMTLSKTVNGFALEVVSETGGKYMSMVDFAHQEAKKPQRENIVRQLTKLGNTIYRCRNVEFLDESDSFFIPSSLLADLRREAVDGLSRQKLELDMTVDHGDEVKASFPWQVEYSEYPYLYNISNSVARDFYKEKGLECIADAFEVDRRRVNEPLVMQCRHCIRFSLGYCVKRGGVKPSWREPLRLELPDGRRFRLEFVCTECQMNVYAEK